MTEYHVSWTIDLEADTPEQAARQALEIQRDPSSIATVFEVSRRDPYTQRLDDPWDIDLTEIDDNTAVMTLLHTNPWDER